YRYFTDSFECSDELLSNEILSHFKPYFSLRNWDTSFMLEGPTIVIQDISDLTDLHKKKIEASEKRLYVQAAESLVRFHRIAKMHFERSDLDGLFTVTYLYCGKEYSVSFLRESDIYYTTATPWDENIDLIIGRLKKLLNDGDKRFALEEAN